MVREERRSWPRATSSHSRIVPVRAHGDGVLAPLELPGAGRTQNRVRVVVRFGHEPRQGAFIRDDTHNIRTPYSGPRRAASQCHRRSGNPACVCTAPTRSRRPGARGHDLGVARRQPRPRRRVAAVQLAVGRAPARGAALLGRDARLGSLAPPPGPSGAVQGHLVAQVAAR